MSANYLGILIGGAAGAALGYHGARYALHFFVPMPGTKWLNLLPVLALPVRWLIAVGLHELGHILGGWLGGGTFMLWLVGPLMLRRPPAGVRAGWNRCVNLSGGMAVCVPLDQARVTPAPLATMIGGGPLASLLLGLGALALAYGQYKSLSPVKVRSRLPPSRICSGKRVKNKGAPSRT